MKKNIKIFGKKHTETKKIRVFSPPPPSISFFQEEEEEEEEGKKSIHQNKV